MSNFRLPLLCLLAFAVFAAPLVTAPAHASDDDKSAEELAVEGLSRLLRALEVFIDEIPQYEAPEINEDGDIIIRRKNPKEDEDEEDQDEDDDESGPKETST